MPAHSSSIMSTLSTSDPCASVPPPPLYSHSMALASMSSLSGPISSSALPLSRMLLPHLLHSQSCQAAHTLDSSPMDPAAALSTSSDQAELSFSQLPIPIPAAPPSTQVPSPSPPTLTSATADLSSSMAVPSRLPPHSPSPG